MNDLLYSELMLGKQTDRQGNRQTQSTNRHAALCPLLTLIAIFCPIINKLSKSYALDIFMQICMKQNVCIYIKNIQVLRKKSIAKYKSINYKSPAALQKSYCAKAVQSVFCSHIKSFHCTQLVLHYNQATFRQQSALYFLPMNFKSDELNERCIFICLNFSQILFAAKAFREDQMD